MPPRKLLWIENCYPISTRSARILTTLSRSGDFKPVVCAWRRQGELSSEEHADQRIFTLVSPPGRLLHKLRNLPRYAAFVRRTIEQERADMVGCSNWDMALLAGLGHANPVLYDVADMPDGRGLYFMAGRLLERIALRRTSGVILASRFFSEEYSQAGLRQLVYENYPDLDVHATVGGSAGNPLRVAFIGNVRFPETLNPLLRVAIRMQHPVAIYGGGAAVNELQRAFNDPHVVFSGPYRYPDLSAIYRGVDIVWAAYPARDENVRRAISNKFFESLWFGIPGVFSANTKLGELVSRLGIGFTIDAESEVAVQAWLSSLRMDAGTYDRTKARLIEYRTSHLQNLTWRANEGRLLDFARELMTTAA